MSFNKSAQQCGGSGFISSSTVMVITRVYYLLSAQCALLVLSSSTDIWFISLVVFGSVCANNGNDADSNLTCVNRKL